MVHDLQHVSVILIRIYAIDHERWAMNFFNYTGIEYCMLMSYLTHEHGHGPLTMDHELSPIHFQNPCAFICALLMPKLFSPCRTCTTAGI